MVLAMALVLWACGGSGTPEGAAVEPVALATAEAELLTCLASEVTSGQRVCAGNYTYSLRCDVRRSSPVCEVDTSPKTCTRYNTCQHPDFGRTRGTYQYVTGLGLDDAYTCEPQAQAHLSQLTPEERTGVTYSWMIGGPGGGGEEMLVRGGGDTDAAAWDPTSIQAQYCYITYYNYPINATGTGPQCGESQYTCSPACVNPRTCQVNGAWVTSAAQCGTMVGACGPSSVSPLYQQCRHSSHGQAPVSNCGAGFDGLTQAPAGSTPAQVESQAAAQWTAATQGVAQAYREAPAYDAPITCADCRFPVHLTDVELRRRVYASVAMAKKDAKLHILAGSAYYLSRDNPTLSQTELVAGLNAIASALNAYSVPAAQDASGPTVRRMLRILSDAQAATSPSSVSGRALRAFTRELLVSMRLGLEQKRRLTSLLPQVDRYVDAEAFVSESWGRLHERTQASSALASAVNDGAIGSALGVRTTDSVQQMLTVYPLEPLKTFVLAHLQSDGSLGATVEQVRTLVQSAGARGLSTTSAYATNLFQLNAAEQTYRNARATLPSPAPSGATAMMATASSTATPEDALKAAIDKAKARNDELKTTLKDAKEGVSGALGLAADLAKKSNDPEFATDIQTFGKALETAIDAVQKYSESSVEIAKKVAGILELGATGFEIVSAAIFTGQMVGAVLKIISLFNQDPAKPPTDQVILRNVEQLTLLVKDIRREMKSRFDRTDRKIDLVYGEMLRQFGKLEFQLGIIDGNVTELQAALFAFQADLNRLDRNVYVFLDAQARRPFMQEVNGKLGWRERVTDPNEVLIFNPGYTDAENTFHTWAYLHASDPLAAGADGRAHSDDALLNELINYPLTFNVNYLRTLPASKFQLGTLAPERLSSPLDWTLGAEAWVQLAEEWPHYAANIDVDRRDELITTGGKLRDGLRNISQPVLFTALSQHYNDRWNDVKGLIDTAEAQFEAGGANGLYGVDMWSGPDQLPAQHFFQPPAGLPQHYLRRCDGAAEYKAGVDSLPLNLTRWPHDELKPFMLAHNLGLGRLDSCIEGHWSWHSWAETPWGAQWTFRIYAQVFIRYNGQKIYVHRFNGTTERSRLIRYNDPPFNPDTFWDPYPVVADNWGSLSGQDSLRQFTGDSLRTQVRTQVSARLVDLQKVFYGSVASRLSQAGDALAIGAQRLSGSKVMWESYVAMGFPLSLEHNEVLREQLYGEGAVLTGRDVQVDDAVANDLEDTYRLFSAAPPARNAMVDIDAAARARSTRLKNTLDSLLARVANTGDWESDAWVEATMLRLRASAP